MSRERTQEQIAVMQAYVDGETIQRMQPFGKWADDYGPDWNWEAYVFRVKPKPREFWVNIYTATQYNYGAHRSRQAADNEALPDRVECIKVREVLE